MKSQLQLCREIADQIAARNRAFMELVHDPVNPMTNDDLRKLVERWPERYGQYAGLIGKLDH